MNHLSKAFAATLQSSHLKRLGFEKRYETFSRSHPKFTEHYHLQHGIFHRPGEPWTYQLIIGIGFACIPVKQKGQLAGTHVSKRHLTITTGLLETDHRNVQKLLDETSRLTEIILGFSSYLQLRHETLRHSYDRGILHEGFPADPDNDPP